jgi:hypothetical protein
MRRLRKARQAFTRAADLGDQIGARLWAQLGRVGLGFTALLERKLEEAELSFGAVLDGPEELRYPRARAMTGMGSLELERGNLHLADDWSCSAIEICEAAPYVDALLDAQMLRAHTLLALGMPEDARTLLRQVHSRSRDIGARSMEAQTRRALGEMKSEELRAQGGELGH